MSVDSDKSRMLLSPRDSRTTPCVFQPAEEKDDIPGVGDDSVLEMLSYSKFSDLETWLCMPSTLLPRALESTLSTSSSSSNTSVPSNPCFSTCSDTGRRAMLERPQGSEVAFLKAALGTETPFLMTPLCPILSSTPCSAVGTPTTSTLGKTPTSAKTSASLMTSTPAKISTSSKNLPASSKTSASLMTSTSPKISTSSKTSTLPKTSASTLQKTSVKTSTLGRASALTSASGKTSTSAETSPIPSTSPAEPVPSFQGGVSVRKRRRLGASPGGLRWNAGGSVLRDFGALELSSVSGPGANVGTGRPVAAGGGGAASTTSTTSSSTVEPAVPARSEDHVALRKAVSVDDRLLRPAGWELQQAGLLGHLEKGRKKLRGIQSLGTTGRYETKKKSESKISRLAQKWNRRSEGDALIKDLRPLFYTGACGTSLSLDSRRFPVSMTQPMQNLQLTQCRKVPGGPASPSAAKRLYRNLSEKLRGSTSSFEDTYFFGKSDRLRKASTMQGSDCILEAVEQQDLDTVQILLYQYTADELDLNTPNSQGLTSLDIAIMTNNTPIAKLLLKAGGKESPHFVSVESREAHLSSLVVEAERRADELAMQAQKEGLSLDACHKDKQLRAWEWRSKLYKRMRTGFQHARAPEAPSLVRLNVSSSTSLTVTFQEPQCLNSTVVTKYRVEWSCLKDFSLLAGEMVLDNLQTLKCIISGLTTGRLYYVRVSAYNMKGWGPTTPSLPPSAAPSNWRDGDGPEPRRRGQVEAMERLLQQVRATHTHYCCGDSSKHQNPSRKQSVSRSLKHLFNSSNKFVKTLKRGIYLAAVFYHKDSLLVTAEDQIPIVEVDDSYSSSLMQDFLWFTKLSCMWEDVRWLRQSMSVSMSSSSTLQARHKMLTAAGQLQNLLGTHNLGRVHYEPIKDRHGNVLLVTVRDMESQYSFFSGKWMQVTKLQSQRKSLSTPEEPYALDILIITIQDILSYQRRSAHRLSPGLYLGYLKLSSSVDQIKVLVSQRSPNMLCHVRVRENANVSREEWDWLQNLSPVTEEAEKEEKTEVEGQGAEAEDEGAGPRIDGHTPLLYYELQTAVKSLLKVINLPLLQAKQFRVYGQEVLELGHGVSFLLLLPSSDDVCTAPGQANAYTPHSGFLHLPLQMFELVHFWAYKEKFISLYCRLSSVLDLDALITQQALREAITDVEVSGAKQRHQLILDYIQQLDEMWRDLRWITDALQYARYKHPRGGVPITCLVSATRTESDPQDPKTDSTSSTMDYLPTPSPSPELRRRTTANDTALGSDEDGSSEVFLPTDSDYDSSDALSPRDMEPLYSSAQDLSTQALHSLGGSAPDVLQIHEIRYSVCSPKDFPFPPLPGSVGPLSPFFGAPLSPCLLPHSFSLSKDLALSPCTRHRSPSLSKTCPISPSFPLSPRFSKDMPLSLPLSPSPVDGAAKTLETLSLSPSDPDPRPPATPLRALANPPSKRKLLSRSHRGQYFSGPQRWLRGHGGGEGHTGSLSEGVYTRQRNPDLPGPGELPSPQGPTFVSQSSCLLLESRRGRHRDPRPHVRRIFVEPCKEASPGHESQQWREERDGEQEEEEEEEEQGEEQEEEQGRMEVMVRGAGVSVVVVVEEAESGGEGQGPDEAGAEGNGGGGGGGGDQDSDDQSNEQLSEILSSTL